MNKIDFDSFLDDKKKKRKEAKKQLKKNRTIKALNSVSEIHNKNSQPKDIIDIGFESSGIKNKLELSEEKEKIFISDIRNNNLEIKKKAIRLFFKEKDPKIQIKYDNLDLYSVNKTLNKIKNTIILLSDKKLKEKIIRDILIIDEVTIKDYLPDSNYNPFLQNRTATICLAVQEYLKIISIARYEKYFKSMKWLISLKYTINDYYMYRKYREIFFDESMCMTCSKFYGKKILIEHEKKCKLEKLVVCEFCQVKVKQKNLKKHLKKKCEKYKTYKKQYKTPIERLKELPPIIKVEEVDISKKKDFKRLEQLYVDLFSNGNKLSIVEEQTLKNDIKRLEIYFSEEEKLNIKEKVYEKLGNKRAIKVNKAKNNCPYCNNKLKSIEGVDSHVSTKHQDKWEEYFQDEEVKKRINKQKIYNSKDNKFYCERCNKPFKNIDALNQHMASKKHFDDWEEYFNRDDVKKRLLEKKLVHCKDKHQLIKENNLNKSIQTEDKIVELKKTKLKEQILKHKSEIEQYDEDINDELLTDEEEYYDNIRKKIEHNTRNYKKIDREKILKQYVYTTKKSAIDTTLRNEIRSYLYEIYRGYCQICGFTFRKSSDNENSFEMHNWDNKLVVKSKRYLVSSADSLCLCRNCSANIKFGAFNPLFVDKIHNLKSKNIDEVKELICNKVDKKDVVDRFQEFYEWEDIYALEITVNDEPKNIYMTNGHLIQFIAYLQLEEEKFNG